MALPTLAALTPSDVEVVLTDENVEPIDFEEKIDLVGITGMTCVIPRSYEIADEYRRRGIPVVMGGIHASMLPEEAISHCNSVVIGEAEEIWIQVVKDAHRNNLQKFYRAANFPDLTNSPMPKWELLKNDKYCYFTVQAGRGCPYDCEFCSVKEFNGRHYRNKTVTNVVKELELLQGLDSKKLIFFADDNLLAISEYAKELCSAIEGLKIRSWMCQASINKLKDDRVVESLKKAGCKHIFVGFESITQKGIDIFNKNYVNNVAIYKSVIEKVHLNGIGIFGSFILGGDTDNESIFEDTFNFIMENSIAFSMINILTLLPGTRLFKKLEKAERIISRDWWKSNADWVCFRPRLMTSDQLQEGQIRLIKKVYSYKNMYKRLRKLWNLGIYLKPKTAKLFTFGRALLSIKYFFDFNLPRRNFMFKSLWYCFKKTSITWILTALNYNQFANRK
ncbi:MAG: B12-binding domain-containing radical SAM protein [Candidatus Thorarchaeota archaeon]